jgi:hypothetical protein
MIQKIAILLISIWLYMPLVYGATETGAAPEFQEQLAMQGTHAVSFMADSAGVQVQIDGVTSFIILPRDLNRDAKIRWRKSAGPPPQH